MKKKELKEIAKRIAKAELTIENSDDKEEINSAKQVVFSMTERLMSTEDILAVDAMVQEILSNKI